MKQNHSKIYTSYCSLFLLMAIATIVVQLWVNLPAFPTYESSGEITAHIEQPRNNSDLTVKEQIRKIAKVSNKGDFLVSLAQCESTLNPDAVGGLTDQYHGLYQIYVNLHDDITLECSHNIKCSTIWTMEKLNNGKSHMWPNCP